MICPACRTEASGAYCPSCGVPLQGARCRACEAPLLPGARYCNQCGRATRRTQSLPWYIAGTAVVLLITALVAPALRPKRPGPAAQAPPMSQPGRPGPLTGTPREQADRLFNRVMEARAAGDTGQVAFFLPMALAAYEQAGELDADGLYHLSLLQSLAGQPRAALNTAERVLATSPDHLLALAAAAEAARDAGDHAAARRYYERFLAVYDTERARQLPEYLDHSRILPLHRQDAERFLAR
jgi:tetratricopeptide (TPR) repeat protein